MPIYKALLKYGHSQFIFDIMEYCNPEDIVMREQFYLDNFDFDYNVQDKANGTPSRRHRADTLELLRKIATNKKHSEENCKKMRDVWAERKFNNAKVENISANVINKKARKQILGKLVIVKNIDTNGLTEYLSISEAALALNITRTTLRSYVKNQKILTILKQEGNVLMKENLLITVE
jgi:group I intron endonuclease